MLTLLRCYVGSPAAVPQVFNKQITLFREAVFIIFGYRVEMATDPSARCALCCAALCWLLLLLLLLLFRQVESSAPLSPTRWPLTDRLAPCARRACREFKAQFVLRPQQSEEGSGEELVFRLLRDGGAGLKGAATIACSRHL